MPFKVRYFATSPPTPPNLDNSVEQPKDNPSSNLTVEHDLAKPPSQSKSQTYDALPEAPKERIFSPITSKDWIRAESGLEPVPETNWLDSDKPVPLNKDYPLTQREYDLLHPDDQSRLAYEQWRRGQFDFIRENKFNDASHLHPIGDPFNMPMVAYHRNYAPEGTTPPPVQSIPWQLRRPWSWIRRGGLGLFIGVFLATMTAWLIQYDDEWDLRRLEGKSPAPSGWPEKARGYYAVALRHRENGELQLAVWALQRALVEAGYRWIVEPGKPPETQRKELDSANAWVVRTLVMWEIELEHWDKAIQLMDGVSTAYETDDPINRARRSDLLRILAVPTEKTKGVHAASTVLQSAMSFAGLQLPQNPNEIIILPEGTRGNPLLLRALEDYTILQMRHGLKSPKQALPTLLSIAKVYGDTPYRVRDICSEGAIMLHIGEVMYALGHPDESLQWTERAVKSTRRAIPQQNTEEDRKRCSDCIGAGCSSLGILYEV